MADLAVHDAVEPFMAAVSPRTELALFGLVAVAVAFLSASQDAVYDAYRSDLLPPRERRERFDRGDRGDRGERRPAFHAPAPPPVAAPVEAGPAMQAAPGELPQPARSGAPLVPPLMPPQPAWKQEARQEQPAGTEPGEEKKA